MRLLFLNLCSSSSQNVILRFPGSFSDYWGSEKFKTTFLIILSHYFSLSVIYLKNMQWSFLILHKCCWKILKKKKKQVKLWPSFGFPGCSGGKESACNGRDSGSIPVSGRSPGERNGYLLQYSCLENSKDRGFWLATIHMVTKSQTWLSD